MTKLLKYFSSDRHQLAVVETSILTAAYMLGAITAAPSVETLNAIMHAAKAFAVAYATVSPLEFAIYLYTFPGNQNEP